MQLPGAACRVYVLQFERRKEVERRLLDGPIDGGAQLPQEGHGHVGLEGPRVELAARVAQRVLAHDERQATAQLLRRDAQVHAAQEVEDDHRGRARAAVRRVAVRTGEVAVPQRQGEAVLEVQQACEQDVHRELESGRQIGRLRRNDLARTFAVLDGVAGASASAFGPASACTSLASLATLATLTCLGRWVRRDALLDGHWRLPQAVDYTVRHHDSRHEHKSKQCGTSNARIGCRELRRHVDGAAGVARPGLEEEVGKDEQHEAHTE